MPAGARRLPRRLRRRLRARTRTSCGGRSTTSPIRRSASCRGAGTYLNRDYGPLTQGMGMLMDGHFVLEQTTRSRGGYIFNFNGTAGIWRRAGDRRRRAAGKTRRSARTPTSPTARYLAGYRGVYLSDLPVPSELPVQITALKSQQHRWAKGLTECFLKLDAARLAERHRRSGGSSRRLFHLGAQPRVSRVPLHDRRGAAGHDPPHAGRGAGAARGGRRLARLPARRRDAGRLLRRGDARSCTRDWVRRLRWLPFFPLRRRGPRRQQRARRARGAHGPHDRVRPHARSSASSATIGASCASASGPTRAAATSGRPSSRSALGGYYVYMGVVQWRLAGPGALVTLFLSLGLFMTGGATLRALWLKRQRALDRRR